MGIPDEDAPRVLQELCYALGRSNIDWAKEAATCGDHECGGNCRYIALVRMAVRAVDGFILPSPTPDVPPAPRVCARHGHAWNGECPLSETTAEPSDTPSRGQNAT